MRVRVNRPTINWSEVWISTDWSYRSGPSAHVALFLGSIVHLRHEALMDGLVRRERRKQNSKPTPLTVVGSDMSKPVIYLVMGSFRKKENAEKLGAEHTGIGTAVSKVVSDGRTMYRLLAGPIEKASLTSVRFNLAKAGIRNSWAIRLCRGSFTIPPCKPVVQQAALP